VESDGFFFAAGNFNPLDNVNGGGGADNQVALRGDFAGPGAVIFGTGQLTNIETVAVLSSQDARYGRPGDPLYSYTLTFQNGATSSTGQLTVTGSGLNAGEVLIANGAQEATDSFRFIGGAGADQLTGGAAEDILFGGLGSDQMVGNLGADTFVYTNAAQSTLATTDSIGQFRSDDIIDISAIDANTTTGGNQDFAFIGSQAFSNTAGELRVVNRGGQDYDVFADTDGDGDADFALLITGALQGAPTAANFLGLVDPGLVA
jgi:Ca2+-binding RTX toxin-like protein